MIIFKNLRNFYFRILSNIFKLKYNLQVNQGLVTSIYYASIKFYHSSFYNSFSYWEICKYGENFIILIFFNRLLKVNLLNPSIINRYCYLLIFLTRFALGRLEKFSPEILRNFLKIDFRSAKLKLDQSTNFIGLKRSD